MSVLLALLLAITITPEGFEPATVSINKGTTITFVNKDKVARWPASNIHPTHLIYPEFDPKKPIRAGDSWTFKFNKAGTWKYHDHLFPHQGGVVKVIGEKTESKTFFDNILGILRKLRGVTPFDPQSEWKKVADHDQAHFFGSKIWGKFGISAVKYCQPSFAFGCYHGFSDSALSSGLEPLPKIAKACELVGKVDSGPWASCIHGIGHGVGTYFQTNDLQSALSTCSRLKNGKTYCFDGVFMEFVTSASKAFYSKGSKYNPFYPCESVSKEYRQACARNQPSVMTKFYSMSFEEIAQACLKATDKNIRFNCIDSIGLGIGQKSKGDPEFIKSGCGRIKNLSAFSQCVSAAAGEIIFQNFQGWQENSKIACQSLPAPYNSSCQERIEKVRKDYFPFLQ